MLLAGDGRLDEHGQESEKLKEGKEEGDTGEEVFFWFWSMRFFFFWVVEIRRRRGCCYMYPQCFISFSWLL